MRSRMSSSTRCSKPLSQCAGTALMLIDPKPHAELIETQRAGLHYHALGGAGALKAANSKYWVYQWPIHTH